MKRRHRGGSDLLLHAGLASAILVFAAGCVGGQSTDDVGDCTPRVIGLLSTDDQRTPLGFSASDLAWALRSEATTGRWSELPGVVTNAALGNVPLRYGIVRSDERATVVDSCGAVQLITPVTLSLATDDGLLKEVLPAKLSATRVDFVTLDAPVNLNALQGTFTWTGASANTEVVQPEFTMALTPKGASGWFESMVQTRTSDAVSVQSSLPLLVWPADATCRQAEAATPLEPNSAQWVPLSWARQGWTGADAKYPTDMAYAAAFEVSSYVCEPIKGTISVPASLRVQLAANTNVSLPGGFTPFDGGLSFGRGANINWNLSSPTDGLSAWLGDNGIVAQDYAYLTWDANLTLSSDAAFGSLRVVGYLDGCNASCSGAGCSGCGPLTAVTLLEILLSPASGVP